MFTFTSQKVSFAQELKGGFERFIQTLCLKPKSEKDIGLWAAN